jgi:hypothetical protein
MKTSFKCHSILFLLAALMQRNGLKKMIFLLSPCLLEANVVILVVYLPFALITKRWLENGLFASF